MVKRKIMIGVPREVNTDSIQMNVLTTLRLRLVYFYHPHTECEGKSCFYFVCSHWGGGVPCSSRFGHQMSGPTGERVGGYTLKYEGLRC